MRHTVILTIFKVQFFPLTLQDLMATAGLCNSTYHPGSLDSSCGDDGGRNVDWAGLLLVFFGVVLTGVGNCCYYMFGVPYLDDNTKHENAPFMLGAVYTFRDGITMLLCFV